MLVAWINPCVSKNEKILLKTKALSKIKYLYFSAFVILLVPIVFWFLPSDQFDVGTSICPSKLFFNIECLGCGMTRAIQHMHHLEIDEAAYYNAGSFIVYPALAIFWGVFFIRTVKKIRLEKE